MENWDEVRTAYHVARAGTVSGAAEALGVHHATVIRHIDALEARLGVKLFQRHARGYTPTEAGEDLLRVGRATDDQFSQLAGRIKGRGSDVSGELVVTALPGVTPRLAVVLSAFQEVHPGVIIRLLASDRVFRLEYGEAHVAIRARMDAPEEPDNVVQRLATTEMALFGSRTYCARYGQPKDGKDLEGHRFVSTENSASRAPYAVWLREQVPPEAIVFRTDDFRAQEQAVLAGAGLGFLPAEDVRDNPDLIEVLPPRDKWRGPLWLVTHMDLHRTAKVQALVQFLKEHVR
ncbi:LysR family transcriptional regulator [Alisedimentitalea sp. MJ-SS2]|uniref:LysR family transcriptional regulator n=1 Tax=Aliisedimentitalea sp. MJ-SS2 TaxID=3049795 RepID=UPI00290B2062|nr:LysR family transcriptional regulator [Alisedimentitalea sp. MJ-SS2]MDU8927573.1 LysR family transcriptional regulator [Alisedimentitalea sp. MJ-SS2]